MPLLHAASAAGNTHHAVGAVAGAHLLVEGGAAAGGVEQGILLVGIGGHVVVAAHAGVHELDDDLIADAFEIAIAPALKGIGGGGAAAFGLVALILTAGGMGLGFVGWTPDDINASAVGSPARDAGGVMLVGILNAAIVFFAEFVFLGVGSRVAAEPELLDELVTLLIGAEEFECLLFFRSDDVAHVLVEPGLVGFADFVLKAAEAFLALLGGKLLLARERPSWMA